jgi:hypothetical protein
MTRRDRLYLALIILVYVGGLALAFRYGAP